MTKPSGYAHATPNEVAMIKDLEARIDPATSPPDQVLRLAQLFIEPAHRTEEAVALLETALSRDPEHPAACYWWADCAIRFLMDEKSLQRATQLLERTLRSETEYAGAGCILLVEALHDLEKLSLQEEIELYEASVRHEPGWVNNRRYLGLAYEKAGRLAEGADQLRAALANLGSARDSSDPVASHWERVITGRVFSQEKEKQLKADLERLRTRPHQ